MEAPITASQGAMRSLPWKLELLLSKPSVYELQKGEKNKIRLLKGEIQELIDKYLMEPSEVESPALTANCWAKEVREMSYDIHDFVDELVDAGANIGVVQKTPRFDISRFWEKLKRRQGITDHISGFRTRVKEAIQRHRSYLGNCKWRPSSSTVDERAPPALYGEAGLRLVAMDKSSIGELYGWLANDGQPKRKVVSIVGIGGVGKTTLANEMYRKLGGQFQCRAFVRTSRRPDMKRILTSILSQVRRHQPPNDWEMHNLVVEINAYLKDKTYFIIIDDLWASSTWDIINRALPKSKCCSRILTTTEVDVVAQTCCADNSNHMPSEKEDNYSKYIFKKELLSEDESRELFSSRVFGHQSESPKQLEEVQLEIIKRIGGLPLSIITTASVLACQPASTEQWNYIKNSLSSNLITNANPERIKQVLDLGYSNLPHRLKACMLYLSLYEEDYIIWKDDLVKQWIAEGFICAMEGNDREELARIYFDELVNRGMIQPVDINCNDEVLSCTVHRMVLHLIRYKSIEENFVTAIDHTQSAIRLADKVRRLSLHFSNAEHATPPASLRLSQVRSLSFFGLFKCIPSIVEFKLLRVLILQLWVEHGGMSYDLTEISELFRLRCLHISACHLHVILPMQMQRLKVLETLKIEAKVTAVPSGIVNLTGLSYLRLPSEAHLPTGIGRMTSLRNLGYFDLGSNSEDNVKDLGKLTDLQDLHLTCSTVQPADNLENNMKCLGSILGKLSSLKCLALVPAGSSNVDTLQDGAGASDMRISCDGFSMVSPPLALLQRLELSRRCCIISSLPKWIEKHDNLCILKIAVRRLSREDIDILEGLRALTALSLYIQTASVERIVFRKAGFSFCVLKFFKFRCSAPRLLIEKDAMPKLQKLRLGFNDPTVDQHSTTLISIEHLSGLMEISAKIWSAGADAESILMTAISNDPSNPKINGQLVNWNFYGEEGPCMATKETLHRAPEQQGEIQEEYPDKCYRTQHEGSREDEKKQAGRRISMQSESPSPLPVSGTGFRNNSKNPTDTSTFDTKGSTSSSVPPTPWSETEILQSSNLRKFTFSELKSSTKNFRPDSLLGEGGFGFVFKGWIDERTFAPVKSGTGMTVAVKKLKLDGFQGHKEWLAEVNYLGQLSHPNLVKLIGYCLEDEQRLLVYEFMPKGSLEHHLFRRDSHYQPLSWNLRMKVALEAARGLAFLHNDKVIYRDFKTSNVLLDSEYNAKLSHFGLAKDGPSGDNSHVSTRVMGTHGYAAPEYLATGHLTAKSDVYTYGVVLLELLTGLRTLDKNCPTGQHNLVEWARPYMTSKRRVIQVLDPRLGSQYSLPTAQKAAALAMQCLSMDARCRPDMDQVVTVLEKLQDAKGTTRTGK